MARIKTEKKVILQTGDELKILSKTIDTIYFARGTGIATDSTGRPIIDPLTQKPKIVDGYSIHIDKSLVIDTGVQRDSANRKFKDILKTTQPPK